MSNTSPPSLSPATASLMASGMDSIKLPQETRWVIYCTLHHGDHSRHSLNVVDSQGTPQLITGVHPYPSGPVVSEDDQRTAAVFAVLAQELGVPLHNPFNPPHSFSQELSNAMLLPDWAPLAYTLQTGVQARGEDCQIVHRLVISTPLRTAVFLGHVLPEAIVKPGPYRLLGLEVALSLPWRKQPFGPGYIFSDGVRASCRFIKTCRLSYLEKQVGPSPSVTHDPRPRLCFPAAIAWAVIDEYRNPHNPCLLLHQNDHLEALSHLRPREHGYFFPIGVNSPIISQQPFIPTDNGGAFQDLMPSGQWFHLFVHLANNFVEYLGVYERVKPSRVWVWHRLTPDEWESLPQQTQNGIASRAIPPGYSRERVIGDFRSGDRSLSAIFLQNVNFDEDLLERLRTQYQPPS